MGQGKWLRKITCLLHEHEELTLNSRTHMKVQKQIL